MKQILGSTINKNAVNERFERLIDYSTDGYEGEDVAGWSTGDYELTDCSVSQIKHMKARLRRLRQHPVKIQVLGYTIEDVNSLIGFLGDGHE